MKKLTYEFPDNFWWGSAASGPQTEGAGNVDGRKPSVWDEWYEKEPYLFHNQIGPKHTSNFYYKYKEYIQLMKETGHNSYRTSIQWTRIIPDGIGKVNQKGIDFYHKVFDEMLANQIEPFVNLYHFDLPVSMKEIGGWENRKVMEAYVNFAKVCFENFGDKIKYWFTFNEPNVSVELGYIYAVHQPGIVDSKKAAQVGHHIILAHAKAVQLYRSMHYTGKIGTIINLKPSIPRSDHLGDIEAAHISELFFYRAYLDPVVKGKYPQELIEILIKHDILPNVMPGDLEIIKNNKVDLLGINYYRPRQIKARNCAYNPKAPFLPEYYFEYYKKPNIKMNVHRGWEIYEKGIYDVAMDIKNNYGNFPFFISESGMGVEGEEKFKNKEGVIEDDYRIEFIKDHLKWIHKAILEGVNILGYHLWTCMDCWSWLNSYKNRYGLIEVNLEENFKATIKKSGRWYKELSKNNGF